MFASAVQTAQAPLTLAGYTDPSLIVPALRGHDAPTVIRELAGVLHREGRITSLDSFCQAALQREALCSTATEPGWALPHARVKGLASPCFAFGRCLAPMAWTVPGAPPVNLVFLLAVPEADARAYLLLISGLARLSKDARLLQELLGAPADTDIFHVLERASVRANPAAS
ncbi:MAG: PTS sugar transporter subunit IIA [Verrucomicrobiota bacterium]